MTETPDLQRFVRFEVRAAERRLSVAGRDVPIGSRAFDLLLLLIAHRDRVVTKQELLASLWPGMVVEENNLHAQVSALRRVLGADAIATVQGRGYRLAAMPTEGARAAELPVPAGPLPALLHELLGRDAELLELAALLQRRPLVTLVGPGGIGKTLLALCVAHRLREAFPGGASWIDLSGVDDAGHVQDAFARALGVPWGGGGGCSDLADALCGRRALLVVDNAEHHASAVAAVVGAIVTTSTASRVLVTSRTPLRLDVETVYRLGALALPPAGASAAQALAYGALALFVRQAAAEDRRFALSEANVARACAVCRALDGVPLALKLAAARLPALGLDAIASRMDDGLRLLRAERRDLPARQRTMEAALDWSHALLAEEDRVRFRRLSTFVGGFSLEGALAASASASGSAPDAPEGPPEGGGDEAEDEWSLIDALGRLADDSLLEVVRADDGTLRYRLPECTRQYAARQLARAGEQGAQSLRHARAIAHVMERAYEDYWRLGDAPWLARVEPELDNVRRALDFAAACDPPLARRLAGAAAPLFMLLGRAPEARRRLAAIEPDADDATEAGLARYWLERSRLAWGIACDAMHAQARRAHAVADACGDPRGCYLALRCLAAVPALLDPDEAARLPGRMASLEDPAWGVRLRAQRWLALAALHEAAGATEEAADALGTLLAMPDIGALTGLGIAAATQLAFLRLGANDGEGAVAWTGRVLAQRAGDRGNLVLRALVARGLASLGCERLDDAGAALLDFARLSRQRGWEWLSTHADALAWFAAASGRLAEAATIVGHADRARRQAGPRDAVAARAREMAMALCGTTLGAARLSTALAAGAALDEHAVCVLAFGEAWAEGRRVG